MRNQFPYYLYVYLNIFVNLSSVIFSAGIKFEKIAISHQIARIISYGTTLNNRNINTFKRSAEIPVIGSSDVQFILYNRMVPEGKIIENPEELQDSNFNDDALLNILIHGWLSSGYFPACQSMKDAYLKTNNSNILVVTWEKIASSYFYPFILEKMEPIADYYVEFLKKLIEIKNVNPGKVHLIGHSLGAHISGMVGKRLQKNGIIIGRITGLDPAYPGFHRSSGLEKLSQSDAAFVDIIHTCGGTLGIPESIGHVDFYPNGGVSPMPGCKKSLINDKCSHSRCWQYFAESILSPFFATKCDTMESFLNGNCTEVIIEMGEHTPKDAKGNYFLSTNCEYPYSLGKDGIKPLSVCNR